MKNPRTDGYEKMHVGGGRLRLKDKAGVAGQETAVQSGVAALQRSRDSASIASIQSMSGSLDHTPQDGLAGTEARLWNPADTVERAGLRNLA